ncbi:MAG: hypothetical protein ABIZ05_10595 [Pseudonocardiaceae bacterium]
MPFEVALWAKHAGPVVVAPRRDGFVEQVDDGMTGVLYGPATPGALSKAIRLALSLPEARRAGFAGLALQAAPATAARYRSTSKGRSPSSPTRSARSSASTDHDSEFSGTFSTLSLSSMVAFSSPGTVTPTRVIGNDPLTSTGY